MSLVEILAVAIGVSFCLLSLTLFVMYLLRHKINGECDE